MENKHSKCFIAMQVKRLNFMPKTLKNTFGGLHPLGELKYSLDPLVEMTAYF